MELINNKNRTVLREILALILLCATFVSSGCITPRQSGHQIARYRPNMEGVSMARGTEASHNTKGDIVSSRPLRPGDAIIIHLRGIPNPEMIEDMVDSRGSVNLPHIGSVRVESKTTAEVEELIESTYKSKKIFNRINVIVVAQQAEFFIQGEVKQVKGRYQLTADLTLLRAIATAGGPTPFAHPKNVDIIRNGEILSFDRKKIREGKATDPLIEPDDIIIVRKRTI